MQAEGAQVASAEARKAASSLQSSAVDLGIDFIGGLTKFDPDKPLFGGMFGDDENA